MAPSASNRTSLSPEEVAALARQARDGSMEALGELYELHSDQVFAHVYRMTGGDYALTEEVTGAAWEKVVQRIATFDPERASFGRYVHVVAHSVLVSIARREGHRRLGRELHAHMIAHGSSEATAEAGPDEVAQRRDEAKRVTRLVAGLPKRQREALMLTVFDGYSLTDAAQIMGTTSQAVKMARLRAFETLRKKVGDLPRALAGGSRVEIVRVQPSQHPSETRREV